MLLILLSLMGYHLWGEYIHEIFGVAFLSITLLHIGLNRHWFKGLLQGEYPTFRCLQVLLNLLLFLVFFCAIVSGLMLSQHLLPNLSIHNGSDFVRKIHMLSVHWGQILIALHLGLHWKMLSNFFIKIWNISPKSLLVTRVISIFWVFFSGYGLYSLIHRNLFSYLFMQVDFSFFNFDESKFIFYIDYSSIIIFLAYLTSHLLWLFMFRNSTVSNDQQ